MKIRLISLYLLVLLILTACGGTLSISLDTTATPDAVLVSTMQVLETRVATLQPQTANQASSYHLDLTSDSETIRRAMLQSHLAWQTLWVEGEVIDLQLAEGPQKNREQVWVDRSSGRFRALSGPLDGSPQALQVSDGVTQERVNLLTVSTHLQPVSDAARSGDWQAPVEVTDTITAHPLDLEIDARLSELIFPTTLAQRGGTFTPAGLENIAGRDAVVVEWSIDGVMHDRFWLDAQTGLILRWDGFDKTLGEQSGPVLTVYVTAIAYDAPMPDTLFSLRVGEVPQFVVDASGTPEPTLAPPQAVFEPGADELYFVINRDPDPVQLVRLPGRCVLQAEPCPMPDVVADFPNQNSTIRPLVWSPDRQQAALINDGVLYVYTPDRAEWKSIAQFSILPYEPVWSPDGEWLVFVVQTPGQNEGDQQDIYAVHPDGSALQDLTNGAFHGTIVTLFIDGWTADGRLAFSVISEQNGQPYLLRLGEPQAQAVPFRSYSHGVVAVSPDGLNMAYSTMQDNTVAIFLSGLNEYLTAQDEPKRIASFQSAAVQQMLWSPDGQYLVFLVNSGSPPSAFVTTVYIMRADGSEMRQLFQQESIQRLTFTGDGTNMIVEGLNNGRIYILPVESGEPRLLDVPGSHLDQAQMGVSWR